MKYRLLSIAIIAALLLVLTATAQPARAVDAPNFVFDLTCDHASLLITGATPGYLYDFLVVANAIPWGNLIPATTVGEDGTLKFEVTYPQTFPVGTVIYSDTFQNPLPAGGNPAARMTQDCGVFGGSPTPPDYVLRTILCDTAVFDTPGGSPVGDNAVTAGQTWFASTTLETAPDGSAWVAVFVAGDKVPYIPAQCVR